MSIQVKDASGASQTVNTLPALGQADGAASLPVVLASDQAALPLPTNAAQEAGGNLAAAATALGAQADAAWSGTGSGSTVALLKAIWTKLSGTLGIGGTVAVSNLPATQAVSATALPLPTGAATAAAQPALNGDGGALAHVTNFPATQPISAAALPLPTGAATAAGQTATQSAPGTAQTTALTVQGNANGIPQPIVSSNPAAIVSSVQTATLAAVALPSQALVNGIVLKADTANAGTIYVGPAGVTAATGWPLKAGESISYGVTNLSAIYMIGANTTDVLHYTGN